MNAEFFLMLMGVISPLLLVAGILLGYWMGRNNIGKAFSEVPLFPYRGEKKQVLEDYDPYKLAEEGTVDGDRHKVSVNTVG